MGNITEKKRIIRYYIILYDYGFPSHVNGLKGFIKVKKNYFTEGTKII